MEENKEVKIIFITDIHQNIDAVKKINFSKYDMVLCGGDILDPNKPDIACAKKIIDLLPEKTFIIPGNCDKDAALIKYMKTKLNYIHKTLVNSFDIPILGIGYSRSLSDDMAVYRKYFLEDQKRIFEFQKKGGLPFILDFCGIEVNGDKINIIKHEESLKKAADFLKRFESYTEDEAEKVFTSVDNLSGGILLSHSPAYGALDKLKALPNIGSAAIRAGIDKIKPKIVLCGHFHELSGKTKIGNSLIFNPGAVKDYKAGEIFFLKKEVKIGFINL